MSLTKQQQKAYETFVHTPSQSFNALVEMSRQLHGTFGISAGSPILDKMIIPTRPGWIRTWLARTSEGKSTMLRIIAKREAQRLVQSGMDQTHYVAFISYEEPVDAQEIHFVDGIDKEAFWRGKVDPEDIIKAAIDRANLPIYWLGESMSKSNIDSVAMTINMCLDAIRAIYVIEAKVPSLIVLDYAQEIVVEKDRGKRTETIIDAIRDVMALAARIGAPIELGSQAGDASADRYPPVPTKRDTEWTKFIAQKTTSLIGMWRVWNTHKDDFKAQNQGITLPGWAEPFTMTPGLTVFGPSKGRHNLLWKMVPAEVDVEKMMIRDLEQVQRVLRFQ